MSPWAYYWVLLARNHLVASADSTRSSEWTSVGLVLVYVAGEGVLVALIFWYALRAGRTADFPRSRRQQRHRLDLTDELRGLDLALDLVWEEEVEAARRRADREARRLLSKSVELLEVRMTGQRTRHPCARLTFTDGTVLMLWSVEPASVWGLRHLPPNAVLQYISGHGCETFVLGTDSTSIVVNGDLLALGVS